MPGLLSAISLDVAGISAGLGGGAVAIDPAVQVLEGRRAQRHDNGTEDKQSNAAFKRNLLEDWIGIPVPSANWPPYESTGHLPSIVLEALFNPNPVSDGNNAGQAEGGYNGDSPWGGQEKQVNQQHDRRNCVETNICRFPSGPIVLELE